MQSELTPTGLRPALSYPSRICSPGRGPRRVAWVSQGPPLTTSSGAAPARPCHSRRASGVGPQALLSPSFSQAAVLLC